MFLTTSQQRKKKGLTEKEDLDFEIFRSIDRAEALLIRARALELAQYSITPEQAGVLRTLIDAGGSVTNADVSNAMIRQNNSVTTLITRMGKLGLVEKKRTGIGTKIMVSITPKGRDLYENLSFRSIHMALSTIKNEDKERMLKYLLQLIEKGRDMLGMDQKLPFLT